MRPLQPRERRLTAIGVLVAVIAGIWLGLVSPLIGGFVGRANERRALLGAYQRNQRVLAGIPVWRRQAEDQRRTAAAYAIVAPSPALAAEDLKSRIAKVASEQGGVVRSVEVLQGDTPSGSVRVRADLQLTMTQLYAGLKRLETEDNYVVIDYLSIAADRALQTGRLAPMDVRLELSAPVQAPRTR